MLNFFVGGYGIHYENVFDHIYQASKSGIVPIISWGVYNEVYQQTFHRNDSFSSLIAKLRHIENTFILRPFYEKNIRKADEWWGACSDQEFVLGWQYLHSVLKSEGVNCKFLFCPNTTTNRLHARFFESLYPGDDWVDFVGLDSYNKHNRNLWSLEHLHPDPTPEEELGHDVAVFQRIAPAKKLVIAEINEYGDGQWTTDTIDYAVRAGAFIVSTFDWNKAQAGGGEIDWRISQRSGFRQKITTLLEKEFWIHNNPKFDNRSTSKLLFGEN